MLDEYVHIFSKLNTDKNRKRWSEVTCHQAPHKPFLLLSVMDLIAQGVIYENFIEPTYELVDTFNVYWSKIMPLGARSTMAYPFPRLARDGVWVLVPKEGYEGRLDIDSISSMPKLREVCSGAKLGDELYQFMCEPESREQLRAVLITTYFAREVQPALVEQGSVNQEAYHYSKELLKGIGEDLKPWGEADSDEKTNKVRDQGFRRAIVTLYEHRCAFCGIRIVTLEGHTVVEAAHIIPWSDSYDDRPTNGMALCRLCHWSFDEGLMSVGTNYEVLVSRFVSTDRNFSGHILTLSDRSILRPDDKEFWPGQKNLEQHRKGIYCG